MKINFPAQYLVLSLVGGALVFPTAALAQGSDQPLDSDKPWAEACPDAVTNRIQSDYPGNTGIYMVEGTLRQFQASNAETGVSGDGEYINGDNQRNKFSFNCIYNIRSGKVSSVSYDDLGVVDETNRDGDGE